MLPQQRGHLISEIEKLGKLFLQENFENLPKAGSILSQTNLKFDLKNFAESLYHYISKKLMTENIPDNILELYNQNLYKKNTISVFEKDKVRQNGIIQNADNNGFLWIELENDGLQKFFHKEIELLY